jgi:MinD-like ATPase involved in chromosome partitioning or flagellar assembly
VTLAAELAGRGQRVLLVDADTYGGCVAQTLGLLDEAPGLAAAARAAHQGTLDLPALARLAPEALPRLRVLTGIPRPDRWTEISAPALERVLELGRTLAEVVLVDCGFCLEDDEDLSYDTQAPRRNAATLTALAGSDAVLAVGAADAVSLQRFVRGIQELGTVPSPKAVPVVNRVRAGSVGVHPEERVREVLARFAGLDAVHLVPEDRDAVDAALLAGRSVVEHAPQSPFRRAVAELATAIVPSSRGRHPGESRGRRAARGRRRTGVRA